MEIFLTIVIAFTFGFAFGRTSLFMKIANDERDKLKNDEVELIQMPSTGYYIVPRNNGSLDYNAAKWVENESLENKPKVIEFKYTEEFEDSVKEILKERKWVENKDEKLYQSLAANHTGELLGKLDKMYRKMELHKMKQHTASITDKHNNGGC